MGFKYHFWLSHNSLITYLLCIRNINWFISVKILYIKDDETYALKETSQEGVILEYKTNTSSNYMKYSEMLYENMETLLYCYVLIKVLNWRQQLSQQQKRQLNQDGDRKFKLFRRKIQISHECLCMFIQYR